MWMSDPAWGIKGTLTAFTVRVRAQRGEGQHSIHPCLYEWPTLVVIFTKAFTDKRGLSETMVVDECQICSYVEQVWFVGRIPNRRLVMCVGRNEGTFSYSPCHNMCPISWNLVIPKCLCWKGVGSISWEMILSLGLSTCSCWSRWLPIVT